MEAGVQAARVGGVDQAGVRRFEDFPPDFGPHHERGLTAPVVAQDDGVKLAGLQPDFQPFQVEFHDHIAQDVDFGPVFVQVHQEVLHAAQEEHALEDFAAVGEDEAAVAVFFHGFAHAAHAVDAGGRIGRAIVVQGRPVGEGMVDGLAHVVGGVPQPAAAPVVAGDLAVTPAAPRAVAKGKGTEHVTGVLHVEFLEGAAVSAESAGHRVVHHGNAVGVVEGEGADVAFAAIHGISSSITGSAIWTPLN